MPDMDSPKISAAIFEDSVSGSPVVKSLHISKRPREESSPISGKRGRGENGDLLSVELPQSVPSITVGIICGNATSPPRTPSLLDPPDKLNRSSSEISLATGASCSVEGSTINTASKADATSLEVHPSATPGRRKVFLAGPPAARPSVAATDPVFHAALLRLLKRRGDDRKGNRESEVAGWQWRGGSSERFDHWPRALHPDVMDLLASVSVSEERVILTGCDSKDSCLEPNENPLSPHQHHYRHHLQQHQNQSRQESSPWRAQRWRACRSRGISPEVRGSMEPPTPVMSSPAATPAAQRRGSAPSLTPSSALRRPGGPRRSVNRVRFSTHDMSVVDTPDPTRDGSERSMVSALGGLQAILVAAEKVRIAARQTATSGGAIDEASLPAVGSVGCDSDSETAAGSVRSRRRGRQFEGYFDRFCSTSGTTSHEQAVTCEETTSSNAAGMVTPDSSVEEEQEADPMTDNCRSDQNDIGERTSSRIDHQSPSSPSHEISEETFEGKETSDVRLEKNRVRQDVLDLVNVLHEMASSDAAPSELMLNGGWGPEHSNATAFYAREIAFLSGMETCVEDDTNNDIAGGKLYASRLRTRYLEVLSCLVRYNLKILLNQCMCEIPEPEPTATFPVGGFLDDFMDESEREDGDTDSADDVPTSPLLSSGLMVIVPGCTEHSSSEMTGAGSGAVPEACGAVAVVPGTGALEFNSEDVAALLTLALRRVHPFMALASRLAVVAEEVGWDDQDEDEDALDDRVWGMVKAYVAETRVAAAESASTLAARPSDRCVSAASSAGLFNGVATEDHADVGDSTVEATSSAATQRAMSDVGTEGDDCEGGGRAGIGVGNESTGSEGLTVEEASDLLEYVTAARFLAHLLSEPVVAAGVSAGRWTHAEHLARQVQMLAEAGEETQAAGETSTPGGREIHPAQSLSCLSDMLCLAALADVQGLAVTMAQQARFAPALEAVLRAEMRRAMKRGQGRQRRLKSRLQALQGIPGVMGFPLVKPGCCLLL